MADYKVIEEKDRNKGLVAAAVFAVVGFVLLLFLSVTEPDPPLQDIPVPMELDQEMILEDFEAFSGGGSPSNVKDPNPTPPEMGDPVVSSKQSTFTHSTGSNGKKPVADPKPSDPNPDPAFTFSGGGTGGSGSGNLFGSGTDDKEGNGTGGSGAGNRKELSKPCKPDAVDVSGTIYLTISIDENGRVFRAENIPDKSSTSSQTTINSAIKAVKDCQRFEPRPGSGTQKMVIQISVQQR
jgi:hypothetical protein